MSRIVRRLALMIGLLATTGCESREPTAESDRIEFSAIPENVISAARAELPKVDFEQAWVEREDGGLSYEIRGRDPDGKTREVKIASDGRIIETE